VIGTAHATAHASPDENENAIAIGSTPVVGTTREIYLVLGSIGFAARSQATSHTMRGHGGTEMEGARMKSADGRGESAGRDDDCARKKGLTMRLSRSAGGRERCPRRRSRLLRHRLRNGIEKGIGRGKGGAGMRMILGVLRETSGRGNIGLEAMMLVGIGMLILRLRPRQGDKGAERGTERKRGRGKGVWRLLLLLLLRRSRESIKVLNRQAVRHTC
jgi:hypothetical protein